MIKLFILTLCLSFTSVVFSASKSSCKNGLKKFSCSEIKEAKREFTCLKSKSSAKKIEKFCKKTPRTLSKKATKATKKKS